MEYLAGVVLQYLRSAKKFPEWASVVIVAGVVSVAFILSPEGEAFHPANFWDGLRTFLKGMLDHAVPLLATQGGTSMAANIATEVKPSLANSPLVPVTDSL